MNITCPNCGFSRDVPLARIPRHSPHATCPKCKFRFPVRMDPDSFRNAPGCDSQPEEDLRVIANRAYIREAERFRETEQQAQPEDLTEDRTNDRHAGQALSDEVPWELAPDRVPWLAAFIQTIIRVMFSAPRFFAALRPGAGQLRPLVFYLLVVVLETLVERGWSTAILAVLAPEAAGDPQLQRIVDMLQPGHNLVLGTLLRGAALVVQLYFTVALLTMIFRLLAPERAEFSLLFQVIVYSAAPSLLCIVPILGSVAGMCWSLTCLLIGCKVALELDWSRTLLGFAPVALIFAGLVYSLFSRISAMSA